MVRAKVRAALAELIANSSCGTGTVLTTFGNKPAGLRIRETTLEESTSDDATSDYPMPFETHINDEELATYRKEQQLKEQAGYDEIQKQQMLTNATSMEVESESIKTANSVEEVQSSNKPDYLCPIWRLKSMEKMWEEENKRATIEVNEIMRRSRIRMGKQTEDEPFIAPESWQHLTVEEREALDKSEMFKYFATRGIKNPMLDVKLSTTNPMGSLKTSPGLGPLNMEDLHLVKENIGLKEPIILRDFPSPENHQVRYEGAKISPSKATSVKSKIQKTVFNNNGASGSIEWRETPKLLPPSPQEYFAEFP